MIIKLLLITLLSISLYANEKSWSAKFEASIYLPTLSGTIKNTKSSDFRDDYGYTDATASYFSLDLTLDYDYVPNLSLGYYNMQDKKNTTTTDSIIVAKKSYDTNTSLLSTIDLQVFNATLYQDFKIKGNIFTIWGASFYTGDVEFDLGVNAKLLSWKYQVENLTDTTDSDSWIKVNSFVFLPYAGAKYYLYDLSLYTNASALSFSNAKSTSVQVGIDYMLYRGLYINAGYLYEQFQAQEKEDTVEFISSGYKFGIKYAF